MRRRSISPALLATLLLIPLLHGCAKLLPGADPFVVRTEQSYRAANDTARTFLKLEYENRDLSVKYLPAAHAFAEQLRARDPTDPTQASALTRSVNKVIEGIDAYKIARDAAKNGGDPAPVNEAMARVDATLRGIEALATQARLYWTQLTAAKLSAKSGAPPPSPAPTPTAPAAPTQ